MDLLVKVKKNFSRWLITWWSSQWWILYSVSLSKFLRWKNVRTISTYGLVRTTARKGRIWSSEWWHFLLDCSIGGCSIDFCRNKEMQAIFSLKEWLGEDIINKFWSSVAMLLWNKACWLFKKKPHDMEHPIRQLYFSIA